jgi:hypothetical protein
MPRFLFCSLSRRGLKTNTHQPVTTGLGPQAFPAGAAVIGRARASTSTGSTAHDRPLALDPRDLLRDGWAEAPGAFIVLRGDG